MPSRTTGQAIVESLLRHDVDTVFGIPGAHTYDLFDALHGAGDRIRFITTRHEQAAGYMAFGYAKSSGKAGVFSVVPGPGVLNAGAALCTALGACTPILCLTADIPAPLIGRGRGILHELPDQIATLRSITKWATRIDHPTQASAAVADAFHVMRSGRPGPAALATPWDVLGQRAEVMLQEPLPHAAQPPDGQRRDRARSRDHPCREESDDYGGRRRVARRRRSTGARPSASGSGHRAPQRPRSGQ